MECAPRGGEMILNALRVALRIFSGKIFLIFRVCRGLRAAPNAIFTGGAAMVKGRSELQMQLTATTPPVKKHFSQDRVCAARKAPVGLLSGRAVCVSRWRGFAPTSSAGLAEMQIKIIIPLSMRRATRSAFSIVKLLKYFHYKPKPPCRGLRGGFGHRKENNMKKQRITV